MKEFLRRLLGIDELQERVRRLESEKTDLELRAIAGEETRAMILDRARAATLPATLEAFLSRTPLQEVLASPAVQELVDAQAVVQRYGFQRYIPPIEEAYPSPVISLRELQEHPERYFHKLQKGFMGFPVGLNFMEINKFLSQQYNNIRIHNSSDYSNNGNLTFFLEMVLKITGADSEPECAAKQKAAMQLVQAAEISDITRIRDNSFIVIDTLDFLANYDRLTQYVAELPEVQAEGKQKAIRAFQTVRFVYLTALEIAGMTTIKPTADLLQCSGEPAEPIKESLEEKTLALAENKRGEELRASIRESLLSEPIGTSYHEIQKLLPIRSKERFRRLAGERTAEILSRDRTYSGLTEKMGKDIRDYSVGESVVLACYFARNIIDHYADLDDGVKAVLSGQRDERISGKCTDYTGLALHYLREYLVPLHPEKFNQWTFGYDTEKIGGYDHCYMKAIHRRPDEFIDVYFIDPTLLASRGLQGMKTPEEVVKIMDTANHPLQIVRDAEDLMYKKKE